MRPRIKPISVPFASATIVALTLLFTTAPAQRCSAKSIEAAKVSSVGSSFKSSPKIVSFAPSCTELIEAIKAQDCLVGVCKFCDLPVTDSARIETVGDFNSANIERLTRLKPDMVLAVSGQNALIHSLTNSNFHVTTFQNNRLSDISKNLRIIGKLTGRESAATAKAKSFDDAIIELKNICLKTKVHPSVFLCVWPQPLLTAGRSSFLSDALSVCGGKNVAADIDAPYPHFSLERLVMVNPNVLIMPYEAKAADYVKRPPWSTLKASSENRIFFLGKEESDRLSRPSTRVVRGLYWMATRLHPDAANDLAAWLKRHADLETIN